MQQWFDICDVADLQPNAGVCALVAQQQVAIFYLPATQQLYALSNYDPIGKANVLSRGIIGDLQGQPVVASPLYKQHFNLQTGGCLEDESIQIPVYSVRMQAQRVEILLGELA